MKKVINTILILIILLSINVNAEPITIQKSGTVNYLYGNNFINNVLEYQIFSEGQKVYYQLEGYKKELGQERELIENGYINDPGLMYILNNGYPTKQDKYFYTKYNLSTQLKNIGYYVTQTAIDMYSQYKENKPSLKVFGSLMDIENITIGNFTGFDGTGQSRKIYDAILDLYYEAIKINDDVNSYKDINFTINGLDNEGNIKLNFEYGFLVSDILKLNTDAKKITLTNNNVTILNKNKKVLEAQSLNNNDEFRIRIPYDKTYFSEERYYILEDQLQFNLQGENTTVISKYFINEDTSEYINGKVDNKPVEKNISIKLGYQYIDYPNVKIVNKDNESGELIKDSILSLYDKDDILVEQFTTENTPHEITLPFGNYYIVVDKQAPHYKDIFNYIEINLSDTGERYIEVTSEQEEIILPDTGINTVKVNYLGIGAILICMLSFLYMGLKKEN